MFLECEEYLNPWRAVELAKSFTIYADHYAATAPGRRAHRRRIDRVNVGGYATAVTHGVNADCVRISGFAVVEVPQSPRFGRAVDEVCASDLEP